MVAVALAVSAAGGEPLWAAPANPVVKPAVKAPVPAPARAPFKAPARAKAPANPPAKAPTTPPDDAAAPGNVAGDAAGRWPPFKPDPLPGTDFRGPGCYLSWLKILSAWLVFLAWVKTTDWLSTDVQELNLKELSYLTWNPIVFGTFMVAFVLLWLLPFFPIGFVLLLLAYVVPLATYITYRNSLVDNELRVGTPEHLRYWFAAHMHRIGVKVAVEKSDPREGDGAVKLFGHGGPDERHQQRPAAVGPPVARPVHLPGHHGRRLGEPGHGDHARLHASRRIGQRDGRRRMDPQSIQGA